MPPKKAPAPSKKTDLKKKEKVIEVCKFILPYFLHVLWITYSNLWNLYFKSITYMCDIFYNRTSSVGKINHSVHDYIAIQQIEYNHECTIIAG